MWPDVYLRSRNISRTKFAEMLGCSESSFQLYMQRKRLPSLITALKIVDLSNGDITCKDLVDFYLSRVNKKEKRKYTRKNAAK